MGGLKRKIPLVGEVWIFSGITHFDMKGFALRRLETEAYENSEIAFLPGVWPLMKPLQQKVTQGFT